MLLAAALACLLAMPVPGPVVQPFAPEGPYGGHWGIDIAAAEGTAVHSAGPGEVTFAGSVAGRLSVTVHHGGGVRTSYSYLSVVSVRAGSLVAAGDVLGASGVDHERAALHYSVRVGDQYVDPLLACAVTAPTPGLRLVVRWIGMWPYAPDRASRHPRRNLRSAAPRPSDRRRGRVPAAGPGRGVLHPGGSPVAEGR